MLHAAADSHRKDKEKAKVEKDLPEDYLGHLWTGKHKRIRCERCKQYGASDAARTSSTQGQCSKCCVGLHRHCFNQWHYAMDTEDLTVDELCDKFLPLGLVENEEDSCDSASDVDELVTDTGEFSSSSNSSSSSSSSGCNSGCNSSITE